MSEHNENFHKRDMFDKKLGTVINNPKMFSSMFTAVIENSSKKSSFGNILANVADIEQFYNNSSVGEYEKMSDRLSDIMEEQNETDVLVLMAALDMKMVNKLDELEASKAAKKDIQKSSEIPAMVSAPDFADNYQNEGSYDY